MLVGKYVAVKILSAEHSSDTSQVERLQRETRVASLVQGPHIGQRRSQRVRWTMGALHDAAAGGGWG